MKLFFLFFFILASFSDVITKGDLTRQKPITKIVNFNSIDGSSHMYEPNILEFETGVLYKLILENKSKYKHYFTSYNFSRSIFTRKVQINFKNQKIAEVKGEIKEIEIFPGQNLEWWFVPVKTGEFNDLFCRVKDKKTNLTHSEMGMTGTIKIY